jgi:hypothetical protein
MTEGRYSDVDSVRTEDIEKEFRRSLVNPTLAGGCLVLSSCYRLPFAGIYGNALAERSENCGEHAVPTEKLFLYDSSKAFSLHLLAPLQIISFFGGSLLLLLACIVCIYNAHTISSGRIFIKSR